MTQTGIDTAGAVLEADFGDGYGKGAVIGQPLRDWAMRVDVLPDSDKQVPKVDDQTRSEYLWNFYLASRMAGNYPFWLEDDKDGLFYLASFVDKRLSYEILCSKIYSTGLQLSQRREKDFPDPLDGLPLLDEAGAYILDESGDYILGDEE